MTLDLNTIFGLGGFIIAILGVVGTGWWRITSMVKDVRQEASLAAGSASALAALARQEIAEQRLHTAEQYVSKEGLREVTTQIMDAIEAVGAQLTEMRGRIDRMLDKPNGRSKADSA